MSDTAPDYDAIFTQYKEYLDNQGLIQELDDDTIRRVIERDVTQNAAPGSGYLVDFLMANGYVGSNPEITLRPPFSPDLGTVANQFFTYMTQSEEARTKATIDAANKTVLGYMQHDIENPEALTGVVDNTLLGRLVEMKLLDSETADWINSIAEDTPISGQLLIGALYIGVALSAIQNISNISGGDFYRNALAKFTPNVPQPNELLKAFLLDEENREEITRLMAENGLDSKSIKYLLMNNEQVFNPTEVRDQFWRGIIDEEQAKRELARGGFTPDRIDAMMATWVLIPSPQDLFWMVAKEAFEEDQQKMFGLDEEFPSEQMPWLEKQGVSPYWAMKNWIAHWSAPSIGQGYEMLHRRLIDEETLDGLFRIVEMPSFWRDKLRKMSYSPYTRVDIRRMYAMHIVDEQTVYDTYRDLGYDDEHATNLTKWTVEQYGDESKQLTRAQIERVYADGQVTREEAVKLLEDIGYSPSQAKWFTENVDFQEVKRLQDREVTVVKKRYINGLDDEAATRTSLSALDISSARQTVYMEEWKLDRKLDEKLPTKAELADMLKHGIIDVEQYYDFMRNIGYQTDVIRLYQKLIDSKG